MKKFLVKVVLFLSTLIPVIAIFLCGCFFLDDEAPRRTMLGELNKKLDYLASLQSPKIIIIGGSGCSHSINSRKIAEKFNMPVANVGLHAALGLAYQLQSISLDVKVGDYVIIVPEYTNFRNCLGGEILLQTIVDVRPKDKIKLDFSQWIEMIQHIPSYGIGKIKRIFLSALRHRRWEDSGMYKYNKEGDMIAAWEDDRNLGVKSFSDIPEGAYNDECIKRIRQFMTMHLGARVILLPPALQDHTFDIQRKFIDFVAGELMKNGMPFIVKPERYRMDDSECWDSPYHLNGKGIARRTSMMIEDLEDTIK